MNAEHEGEVEAVVFDLDVEVRVTSPVCVAVEGPGVDVAERRLKRAAAVSRWSITREGQALSVIAQD